MTYFLVNSRNIPISRIFLNNDGNPILILVIYFPIEDLDQSHLPYDPRNPLMKNLGQKQTPDFVFSTGYYIALLFGSILASIITYLIYKGGKKFIRYMRAPIRIREDEERVGGGGEASEMLQK